VEGEKPVMLGKPIEKEQEPTINSCMLLNPGHTGRK